MQNWNNISELKEEGLILTEKKEALVISHHHEINVI